MAETRDITRPGCPRRGPTRGRRRRRARRRRLRQGFVGHHRAGRHDSGGARGVRRPDGRVVDRFPKLEAVLASTLVSPEEKSAMIDRPAEGPGVGHCWSTFSRSSPAMAGSTVCGPFTCKRTSSMTSCGTAFPCGSARPTPLDPAMARRDRRELPRQAGRRAGHRAGDRPEPDRRGRPPRRRHHLRRLDRQSVAEPSPTNDREECP